MFAYQLDYEDKKKKIEVQTYLNISKQLCRAAGKVISNGEIIYELLKDRIEKKEYFNE